MLPMSLHRNLFALHHFDIQSTGRKSHRVKEKCKVIAMRVVWCGVVWCGVRVRVRVRGSAPVACGSVCA